MLPHRGQPNSTWSIATPNPSQWLEVVMDLAQTPVDPLSHPLSLSPPKVKLALRLCRSDLGQAIIWNLHKIYKKKWVKAWVWASVTSAPILTHPETQQLYIKETWRSFILLFQRKLAACETLLTGPVRFTWAVIILRVEGWKDLDKRRVCKLLTLLDCSKVTMHGPKFNDFRRHRFVGFNLKVSND